MCAKAPTRDSNNRLILCYGRCVTDEKNRVRLSKKGHNHPPMDVYPKDDHEEVCLVYNSIFTDTSECDVENAENAENAVFHDMPYTQLKH